MCGTVQKYSCGHKYYLSTKCKNHQITLHQYQTMIKHRPFFSKLLSFRLTPPPPPKDCHVPAERRELNYPCRICILAAQQQAFICSKCCSEGRKPTARDRRANNGFCCAFGCDEWEIGKKTGNQAVEKNGMGNFKTNGGTGYETNSDDKSAVTNWWNVDSPHAAERKENLKLKAPPRDTWLVASAGNLPGHYTATPPALAPGESWPLPQRPKPAVMASQSQVKRKPLPDINKALPLVPYTNFSLRQSKACYATLPSRNTDQKNKRNWPGKPEKPAYVQGPQPHTPIIHQVARHSHQSYIAAIGTLPPTPSTPPPVPQPEILLPITYTPPFKNRKATCSSVLKPKHPILHPGPSKAKKSMEADIETFQSTPPPTLPEILLPLTYKPSPQPPKRRIHHVTYVETIGSLPPTPPPEEEKQADLTISLSYLPPTQPRTLSPRQPILSEIISPLTPPPSITHHSISSQLGSESESEYSFSSPSEHSLWELEHEDEDEWERGLRSPLSKLEMKIEDTINFVGGWERGAEVTEDTRRRELNVLLRGADRDAVSNGWI